MAEFEQRAGQGARFTAPVSPEEKAAGVTGAILERRSGLFGEPAVTATMNAVSHAGRMMQAPRNAVERQINMSRGLGFATEQERAQFAAKQEQRAYTAEQTARINQLNEADKQHAEQALQPIRSELESMEAAQQAKETHEPETETIILRSTKDGHVISSFTAPKNATRAELNRAAEAAGLDYRIAPFLTTLDRLGSRNKDMWKELWAALKKTWQAAAPPEATQR